MVLAKVKMSKEFMEIFNDKEFSMLRLYLSMLKRDGDCFISEVVDNELNLKLTLQDYFFNEKGEEADEFWKRCNKVTWDIIKVIEL